MFDLTNMAFNSLSSVLLRVCWRVPPSLVVLLAAADLQTPQLIQELYPLGQLLLELSPTLEVLPLSTAWEPPDFRFAFVLTLEKKELTAEIAMTSLPPGFNLLFSV